MQYLELSVNMNITFIINSRCSSGSSSSTAHKLVIYVINNTNWFSDDSAIENKVYVFNFALV